MRSTRRRRPRRRTTSQGSGVGRRRSRKSDSLLPKISALLAMCLVIMLICNATSCWASSKHMTVHFTTDSYEMKEGEALPTFTGNATSDGETDVFLSKNSDYTLGNLLSDLNNRELVPLICGSDGLTEGKYPISVEIPQDIRDKFEGEWEDSVNLVLEIGNLTVNNKYGKWEGEKFVAHDGLPIANAFIESKGNRFYMNSEGAVQKGFFTVDGIRYHSGSDGRISTDWFDDAGGRYFANSDGSLMIGWMNEEEERYYFDENGKAVTGELTVGAFKCVFENGLLVSEEPTFSSNKPLVALTFDDGPGARTMEIIKKLEQYNARATFFMLGQNIREGNYSVLQAMEKAGCELASHTYDHPSLTNLGVDGIMEQINSTDANIAAAVGHPATLMRPPYGAINETVRDTVGKPIIMWSIDTLDWQHRKVEETIRISMEQVQDGSIILIHDIHDTSVDATLELIPKLINAGYELVTVSELAAAKGVTLENGEKYFSIP